MIADAIRFILSNLPSILTLIAFCGAGNPQA